MGAKRPRRGQQMNGLQQTGLAAGVLAIDDIELWVGLDIHLQQIPNLVRPQQGDAHRVLFYCFGFGLNWDYTHLYVGWVYALRVHRPPAQLFSRCLRWAVPTLLTTIVRTKIVFRRFF